MWVNLVTAADKKLDSMALKDATSKAGGHDIGDFKDRLFAQPDNLIVRGLWRIDTHIMHYLTSRCQPSFSKIALYSYTNR